MVKCVVSGCPNRTANANRAVYNRTPKRFFSFPNDPARVKVWLAALRETDKQDSTEQHLICEDHFLPEDVSANGVNSDAIPIMPPFLDGPLGLISPWGAESSDEEEEEEEEEEEQWTTGGCDEQEEDEGGDDAPPAPDPPQQIVLRDSNPVELQRCQCTCVAGTALCSHVAAETDQKWHKPRTMGIEPGPVNDMVILSARPRERKLVEGIRSSLYKGVNCPLPDSSTLKVQDVYHGLPADEAPMITTMAVSSDVPLVESMFGQVQEGSVLSYQLPTRTVPSTRPHTAAPSPPQLPLSDYRLGPSTCAFVCSEHQHHHMASLETSLETAHRIENSTQEQSSCAEWHQLRRCRITSTKFREVCHTRGESFAENLAKRPLRPSNQTADMRRGLDLEPIAVEECCRDPGGGLEDPGEAEKTSAAQRQRKDVTRQDLSLGLLTQRFLELLLAAPDGSVDLRQVATALETRRQRVYDITNVLNGINLIQKESSNRIKWIGKCPVSSFLWKNQQKFQRELENLKLVEDTLDGLIKSCAQQLFDMTDDVESSASAYVTHEDVSRLRVFQEQTVIVVKAPEETKLEIPAPREDIIQIHLKAGRAPIMVVTCEVGSGDGVTSAPGQKSSFFSSLDKSRIRTTALHTGASSAPQSV